MSGPFDERLSGAAVRADRRAGVTVNQVLVERFGSSGEHAYGAARGYQVGMVQCVEHEGPRWASRSDGHGNHRLPMELAVMVSVPDALWRNWTQEQPSAGRLVQDHGGVVTVWATRDDLDVLAERWPADAPAALGAMRETLDAARNDWREITFQWIGEAARGAFGPDAALPVRRTPIEELPEPTAHDGLGL